LNILLEASFNQSDDKRLRFTEYNDAANIDTDGQLSKRRKTNVGVVVSRGKKSVSPPRHSKQCSDEQHTVHGSNQFFKKISKGTLLCIVFTPFRRSIGDSDALREK